ncbi:MAG: hypothetical protein AAGI07_17220 [Bacteroidota bacterium]
MRKFSYYIIFLLLSVHFTFGQDTSSVDEGRYDGKYRKGLRHGRGTCVWADGSKYTGMWKYGTMNGKGIFTFKGYKYDGYWENGMKNGRGTLTFPEGSYYTGEFKDDKYHGFGVEKLADGNSHEGNFRNGKSHGQGKHTWPSGTQYIGEWKNGQMHGQGILIYFDGKVEQGTFKNNEYVPCECEEKKSPLASYQESEAVFVGKVTSIYTNESGEFDEVFFEIEQYWKGEFGFGRTLVIPTAFSSCDLIFFEGESYLVYATPNLSGYYTTTKCSRTQEILFASYDIEQLNAEVPCKKKGSKNRVLNASNTDFVCGCDGQTYRNPQLAKKAGVGSWKKGKCTESDQ